MRLTVIGLCLLTLIIALVCERLYVTEMQAIDAAERRIQRTLSREAAAEHQTRLMLERIVCTAANPNTTARGN